MSDLNKGVRRETGADQPRAFSSWGDFIDHLTVKGVITSYENMLDQKPELIDEILFRWFRQGQVACIFAMKLAQNPVAARWKALRVRGDWSVEQLNSEIDALIPTADAVQITFLGVNGPRAVASLIGRLCESSRWFCNEIDWKFGEHGRSLPVGLRWRSPDDSYTSWALGIASFAPMPFTRKFEGFPFTTLVLRPSPPTDFIPSKNDPISGKPAAHLAHMNDGFGKDEETRNKVKVMTNARKIELLDHELLSTARAQVTFNLPQWCRALMGDKCGPIAPKPDQDEH